MLMWGIYSPNLTAEESGVGRVLLEWERAPGGVELEDPERTGEIYPSDNGTGQ